MHINPRKRAREAVRSEQGMELSKQSEKNRDYTDADASEGYRRSNGRSHDTEEGWSAVCEKAKGGF